MKLEIDGRLVDTRNVTIEPNATGLGHVPGGDGRRTRCAATVRAGTDALPRDNDFHFALSPSRPVSVLLIQADGAPQLSSFYPDDGARHRRGAAVQGGRAARRRA